MRISTFILLTILINGAVATTTRSMISSKTHRCCLHECSTEEKQILQHDLQLYQSQGGEDKALTLLAQKVISGQSCESDSRKRAANFFSLSCPIVSINVANGPVNVSCAVSVSLSTGINGLYIYAYTTFSGIGFSAGSESYYDYDGNYNTSFSGRLNITFPQYSPNGTYTTYGYAYGPSSSYVSNYTASPSITILRTTNDISPPSVKSLKIPVGNVNESLLISGSFVDDLSGVQGVQIAFANGTTTIGYAYWSTPTPRQLAVNVSFSDFTLYPTYLPPGVYNIYQILVYDYLNLYRYYYQADLVALGLQTNFTVSQSNCTAGTYRAYGTTGACKVCAKGTYAPSNGAFRCKACPAGTFSNVTAATSCMSCPPGMSSNGGTAACYKCPGGTYQPSVGQPFCYPCQPGYNSSLGSMYCTGCPYGYTSAGGKAQCTKCPAGTYAYSGSQQCINCLPGTFSTAGSSQCTSCPVGTYAAGTGLATCTKCPAGKTGPAGSSSSLNCDVYP